jgi:hypothetical protein
MITQSIVMLSVILNFTKNHFMLSIIVLSFVILNAVMTSVMEP